MLMSAAKPKIWVPGDWNAFFGFGTNILVNLLTLTGLLLSKPLEVPDDLVFKRILPAAGLIHVHEHHVLCVAGLSPGEENGADGCGALPSGISVLHMFIVTFVIMLPG